jgi:peptidoglycan hydrolase-like protein with peptidoglycan-binding domain
MVRRTASTHSTHTSHFADRPTYGMSSERATEIQSALIQRGYLTGEPTGTWDSASIAAMQKLQGDNGWQTKLVPDSRALIKLGLGPGSTPASTAPVPTTTASVQSQQNLPSN